MEDRLSTALRAPAYHHRGLLAGLPLVFALFCTWHECSNLIVTWTVGGIVFAIGVAIRLWAQQNLHFRLPMEEDLTTSGPYAFVRNPIYIGNIIISISLNIMSGILWLLPITLITGCVVYSVAVRYEEGYLLGRYGEPYAAYMKRIPRWIPRLSGAKFSWTTDYLGASLKAEAHNLLFIIPLIAKDVIQTVA